MVQYPIVSRPWRRVAPPRRVLAIRFQALGDTIITLPYLQDFKRRNPTIEIDLLTRKEVSAIPKAVELFDNVYEVGGGRNAKIIFLKAVLRIPVLVSRRYDAVLDLQNNRISRFVRKALFAKAFVEFDRSSPRSAGERTAQTISALGLGTMTGHTQFKFKSVFKSNFEPASKLTIVLNPAGYCESRKWPIENYVEFAKIWIAKLHDDVKFLLLLMPSQQKAAIQLRDAIGSACVDLTGNADQVLAFQIISKCSLMLSEDSGLMHMAWVQGVPTVALFSSSRKDWSAPQGPRSVCLDSSDLECGPCQLEVCKFGDNRCLTRYSPEQVFEISQRLLNLRP